MHVMEKFELLLFTKVIKNFSHHFLYFLRNKETKQKLGMPEKGKKHDVYDVKVP